MTGARDSLALVIGLRPPSLAAALGRSLDGWQLESSARRLAWGARRDGDIKRRIAAHTIDHFEALIHDPEPLADRAIRSITSDP